MNKITRLIPCVIVLLGSQRANFSGCDRINQASVLVFDEDTSALDTETESSVMQAIDDLTDDLNTIMIAHQTTTFKKCDMTVKLDQGRVVTQHSCSEVIGDQA